MYLHDVVSQHNSRSDEYTLYPIGDIHLGAKGCDVPELKKTIEAVRSDPMARWVGMGDYAEHITMTDKRFDLRTIDPKYRDQLDDLPGACVRDLIEMFKPIKGKCLGLVVGNHEEKLRLSHSNNVHGAMCTFLGVKDLGYTAVIRWTFRRGNGSTRQSGHVFKILVSHGTIASRRNGAKINRMEDVASQFNVDLALFGHGHSKLVSERIELDFPDFGEMRQIEKWKYVVMTGTYRKNHTFETLDYAEKAGYPPVPIGSPRIKFRPWAFSTNRRIEVR